MAEKRPFHETVVQAIWACTTTDEFDKMGRLLMETKIPENHDAIVKAWQKACKEQHVDLVIVDSLEVVDSLLEQKQEVEAEAEAKAAEKAKAKSA